MEDFAEVAAAARKQEFPNFTAMPSAAELGRGSSAGVWLVTEERTRRDFALKSFVLPDRHIPDAYAGARGC